jgi:dTDP-glucose 4,6-dehydratase
MRTILVTGGAGFIGSNLIRYWLKNHPGDRIVNLDAMTYAARLDHVSEFLNDDAGRKQRYSFELCDIRNRRSVEEAIRLHRPDIVLHLAAESHVCRSIAGPEDFFTTNVMGTFNLVEELRRFWGDSQKVRFHHVSTDEVFGELQEHEPPFDEKNPIAPRSPYSCSKAASDMIVTTYRDTYNFKCTISNCSNNYGPNQHEEKLIPGTIHKLLTGQKAKLFGSGRQIRDWLHVDDHSRAIDAIVHKGSHGHRYCIGGETELRNLEVVAHLQKIILGGETIFHDHVEFTNDRPTDDHRYAVDIGKLRQLGWSPTIPFADGLRATIDWYRAKMAGGATGSAVMHGGGAV